MNDTIPRHPLTGLAAVGWRKARTGETGDQPIWPVLGAAEEGETEDDAGTGAEDDGADEGEQDTDPEGADQLGDAGKKALDAMKKQARTERERRKAAETELATLKAKPAEGAEPDAAAIRAEALAAARAETLRDRAMDRLEAKAARLFADPTDARAHLAAQVENFVDGTGVDDDAIGEALTELLTRKPYLGLAALAKPQFQGTGDGGARKGPEGVKQLGKSDLKNMSAEQIVAAQQKGQFRDFMAAE